MSENASGTVGLHATAIIYREHGVLILGPSGSGKSALALALLTRTRDLSLFGALIGDDRIYVRAVAGRLVASGAPTTAGMIERRASGLLTVGSEPTAVIRLVVELSGRGRSFPRMPEDLTGATIEGIGLARLALDSTGNAANHAVAVAERMETPAALQDGRGRIPLEHCAAVHKNGRVALSTPASSAPDARAG
jgi:serine kinase of HPr protein (carbohydrate metabolism regulator)